MSVIKTELHWLSGIGFESHTREHHQFMDGKREFGGRDRGPNPKEYLLASLSGCSGMDIVSLLKKYKIEFLTFDTIAEGELTEDHPKVYKSVKMTYILKTATDIDQSLFIKAADLSMTKYCGVSAMLSKAFPIYYELDLNGVIIHTAQAQFD
jgi:putative redox protein